MRRKAPVFIVSSGRCGSTMMSNMAKLHPKWLSISEFFTSLSNQAFLGKSLSGPELFQRLNTLSPGGRALLGNGFWMEEFLYKPGPNPRYKPEEIPPILCATLPHIHDQPEQLWDELGAAIRARTTAPVADQYRFVFEWLAERFHKELWIERSGASLLQTQSLAQLFPDARFVHLFRDGRDTALSMFKHPFFQLRVDAWKMLRKLGVDPFSPFNVSGTSPWIPLLERWRFRRFDAERFRNKQHDLADFGHFWSDMILKGDSYLKQLPQEKVLMLRFESILAEPKRELKKFAEFVDASGDHAAWIEQVAVLPKTKKPAWQGLAPEEQKRLTEACRSGNELLANLDV